MKDRSEQLASILGEVKANIVPEVNESKWQEVCNQGIRLFRNYSFNADISRRRDTVCNEVDELLKELFDTEKLNLEIDDPTLMQIRQEVWLRFLMVRGFEKLGKEDKDAAREMIEDGKLVMVEARKAGLGIMAVYREALKGFADEEQFSDDEVRRERKELAAKLFGEYLAKWLQRKNPIEIVAIFKNRKKGGSVKPKKPSMPKPSEASNEQNPELHAQIDRAKLANELYVNSFESLKPLIEEELERFLQIQNALRRQFAENNIDAINTKISEISEKKNGLKLRLQDLTDAIGGLVRTLGEENPATVSAKESQSELKAEIEGIDQQIEDLEASKKGKGPIVEKLREKIQELEEKISILRMHLQQLDNTYQSTLQILDSVLELTTEQQENAEEK